MSRKNRNPETQPVQEIEAPTGIELHPDPPETVRVSKRAGLVVLLVLCGLASVFGYGVYRRQHETAEAQTSGGDPRKLVPAITSAKEITKDIPDGIINLAAEEAAAPGETRREAHTAHERDGVIDEGATPTISRTSITNARPTPQPQSLRATAPTAEEKRLAQTYARELQAIAAPTAIRSSVRSGVNLAPRENDRVGPPDSSPLTMLAQLLGSKDQTGKPIESRRSPDREFEEQNMQSWKQAFLSDARNSSGNNYLNTTRTQAISEFEIKAGWEIPAVLEQDLNSDLPGELKALVTANVYDTATGRHLLIPQGARLVGTYDSNVAYAQGALQVVWHRIVYPDASSVDLGGMVGQDSHGSAGFRGDVDNHYMRLIGFAALSSVLSAGFQLSQPNQGNIYQNPKAGEIAAGAVGQEISQLGAQITRKNLNVQPTIKIPIGYRFNVRVNRDILFDAPYDPELTNR